MNVEQGILKCECYSSYRHKCRNAPTTGDPAYADNGVGEWALYLYDGSSWTKVSDEDSANTDAPTLTYNVTAPVGGFGNSTNNDMGNVPVVKS